MSEAANIFMNSYLKKMRRPEMGGGFTPDEAFGANLVHGSESLNPDALRDRTNAQYGSMKSPLQQGGSIAGVSNIQNVPFMGGNQSTAFAKSMSSVPMQTAGVVAPNVLSPWLADKLKDLVRDKPTEVFADTMKQTPTDPMTLFNPPKYDVAGGMGGYEKVGENFASDVAKPSEALSETGTSILDKFNPSSLGAGVATAAAPKMMEALTGSKLAGDITGAAANTGMAAAQGGLNIGSDLSALLSYIKLFGRLF